MGLGKILSLIETNESQLPTEFSLSQNYPNPFNPTTKIEFTIPEKSLTKISIFNVKGRLVKELLNQKMQTGKHSITWNGTDSNGTKVSSGICFYKFQTEEFSQTKKMVLLK